MANSQNGWPSSKDKTAIDVQPFIVYGRSFPGGVKGGDVSTILGYVARRFHIEVEPLVAGYCWGYAYRDVRGVGRVLSNHASGTAIDINAPYHPIGERGTFSFAEVDKIRDIVSDCDGAVRWGGDYVGRPDEMHFEIVASAEWAAIVADRIRGHSTTTEENEDMFLAAEINGVKTYYIYSGGILTGVTGESAQNVAARNPVWVSGPVISELDRKSRQLIGDVATR